jgi:hypothetical protein
MDKIDIICWPTAGAATGDRLHDRPVMSAPRPALVDDVRGPTPGEEIQQVFSQLFTKMEKEDRKYVKWSDPVQSIAKDADMKIATTKFAYKKKPKLETPSLISWGG